MLATFKDDVVSISLRMKNIVNSLLAFNQANAEYYAIHSSNIDIIHLVHNLLTRVQQVSASEQSRVVISGPKQAVINNDNFGVEAILTNLLNNALYYSPSESEVIILVNQQGVKVTVEMINQVLPLIDEKDLQAMFAPLWQKDRSRTSENHFGLGLAIVKRLCEKMNVTIAVSLITDGKIKFSLTF